MYAQLISVPDTHNRNRALTLSLFLCTALVSALWLIRIHGSSKEATHPTAQIDTVELLTLVPLQLEVTHRQRAASVVNFSGAAPAPRFAPKPTPARPRASEIKSTTQPVVAQTAESTVETPKVDPGSLYKKTEHKGSGNDPKAATDHGGVTNGTPTGDYDGSNKGRGGIGLDLAGFRFSKMSFPQDPYEETGRIVFRIKVSAEGEILMLNVVEATVSSTVAQWYKQQLAKLTVVPTARGERPEVSEGRVTIKIVSR